MKPGRQWLVFDAEFFDNSFTNALLDRFGWAGVGLFVAFLCACKTSHVPGRLSYRDEHQALLMMGVSGVPLTDAQGQPFTLDEFWSFTGRYKQTHRTSHGHTWNVTATHWEQWQNDRKTVLARERKRRSRAKSVTPDVTPETDTDTETHSEGVTRSRKPKPPEPPKYPEWRGESGSAEPMVNISEALFEILKKKKRVDD